MLRPAVQYALVGDDSVAYSVFGRGDCNVLFLNTLMASIDAMWEHPAHMRNWRMFDDDLRVAALDHRGFGVSDPIDAGLLGNIDERIKDVLAVADTVGMTTFGIIAELEQTELAVRLALDYPERVERLVITNGTACGFSDDDYTSGYALSDRVIEMLRGQFGTGTLIPLTAPAMAGDTEFAARFERLGGSPGVFAQFLRNLRDLDIRALLPRVRVPTLVMYTGDYTINLLDESRYIAKHVPDAELFEIDDAPDHAFYWGGGAIDRIIQFLTTRSVVSVQRDLATVMFTDIVNSTEMMRKVGDTEWGRTLNFVDDLVADRTAKHGGRVVKQTGDGHLTEFARPSDAVRAAVAISRDARVLGVEVRAGLHTGEVERRGEDLGGMTVHVAARVAEVAGPSEVLVSRTVADLIGGSEFKLDDAGGHMLKGIEREWNLYRAH